MEIPYESNFSPASLNDDSSEIQEYPNSQGLAVTLEQAAQQFLLVSEQIHPSLRSMIFQRIMIMWFVGCHLVWCHEAGPVLSELLGFYTHSCTAGELFKQKNTCAKPM